MALPHADDRPPLGHLTDAQLATHTARGQADALAELYHRYARAMLAVAYRLLQSREDAEDVVHDVFVGLPEALRRYEERGSLGPWLRKVTTRVALMRLREGTRYETVPLDEDRAATSARSPDAVVAIEDALRHLSPTLRSVLVLKEIEGFSHAEIARMLDISVGASEVRLHRALRSLRALLLMEDKDS
ncbi:MAG TPA: sigma-70 family RNA polymerase sigma factor [Gemmatimonadaceae bacterium]|nr:sigma-70 family RNA polymerase sigma factor [Gemmatimonadaceae bacterium]